MCNFENTLSGWWMRHSRQDCIATLNQFSASISLVRALVGGVFSPCVEMVWSPCLGRFPGSLREIETRRNLR